MPITNLNELTKPDLLKHLEEEHGIKVNKDTSKAEIIQRIEELQGAKEPSAPGESKASEGKEGKRPKQVVLLVHEDNDPREYIVVGFNGRNFQIKKGEKVKVPFAVYEILSNAVENRYESIKLDNGKRELRERKMHRHPFSVEDKIY